MRAGSANGDTVFRNDNFQLDRIQVACGPGGGGGDQMRGLLLQESRKKGGFGRVHAFRQHLFDTPWHTAGRNICRADTLFAGISDIADTREKYEKIRRVQKAEDLRIGRIIVPPDNRIHDIFRLGHGCAEGPAGMVLGAEDRL